VWIEDDNKNYVRTIIIMPIKNLMLRILWWLVGRSHIRIYLRKINTDRTYNTLYCAKGIHYLFIYFLCAQHRNNRHHHHNQNCRRVRLNDITNHLHGLRLDNTTHSTFLLLIFVFDMNLQNCLLLDVGFSWL
jgi:hypothetical protein